MTASDHMLLDLLHPGEFLRFTFSPEPGGLLKVSLEGGGGDGDLAPRVEIALGRLRSHGYAFGRSGSGPCETGKTERRIEVRPRVSQTRVTPPGGLGFGREGAAPEMVRLLLPRWSSAEPFQARIAELFPACRDLVAVEAEFVRVQISDDDAGLIQRALDLRLAASRVVLSESTFGRRPSPSLEEAYLALWLLDSLGWEVALRVILRPGVPIPVSLLETAGRAFFHCECDVLEPDSQLAATGETILDLSRRFPRGWSFPALLPAGRDVDVLSAGRLHNHTLPQLPREGLVIGAVEGRRVRLPPSTRDRHTYIVGATGTGKSTLLERMIAEDLRKGEGVVLLDPHGDLYRRVLSAVPRERRDELLCLDPADAAADAPGFNVLDLPRGDWSTRRQQAGRVVDGMLSLFDEIWNMRDAGGPMFELYFRNALLLMALQSKKGGHLPHLGQFSKVMNDEDFRKRLLLDCEDQEVVDFWTKTADKVKGDARIDNIAPYITSKVSGLVQGGFVSRLLCQEKNDLRLRERLDQGGIILVNLDKGRLGTRESRLLGTLLMHEIFAAGLARSNTAASSRRPVNLYVDEFQNFVSDNVAAMLSEARKFGLRLTLANQTLSQLHAHRGQQDLLESVLGNVGNLIAFRLGVPDAERLRLFLDPITPAEMKELSNYHAFARLLTAEGPIRPFIFRTLGLRNTARQKEQTLPASCGGNEQLPHASSRRKSSPSSSAAGRKNSRSGNTIPGKNPQR